MSGNHHHDHGQELGDARFVVAVVLNMVLTVVELVVGVLSGSLALIADAVHNFNDAAALIIAWVARRIARREEDDRFSFGYRRAELIGAMINLTTLVVIGIFLLYESIERMLDPQPIEGLWVVAAAGAATIVDLGTAILLWALSRGNLNVRAAFVHNLTDAAASIAVVFGGVFIWWKGWNWIDPVLTILIASYILWMSFGMLRRTAAILMNNVPPGLDLGKVRATFTRHPQISDLVHLHVWELDENHVSLEAQIRILSNVEVDGYATLSLSLKKELAERFGVGHATIEMLPEGSDLPTFDGCS